MSFRGFTEAVPLSLSSMAHMTMPLEEGVLDGVKQVIQHTLLSCVNYARNAMHPPYNYSHRNLTTSPYAWEPIQVDHVPSTNNPNAKQNSGGNTSTNNIDLPPSLTKLGYQHQYHRTAFLYVKNPSQEGTEGLFMSKEEELKLAKSGDWMNDDVPVHVLGRISLLYATPTLMTDGELNGTEKDDDTPGCVLFKVLVEYRSLPATGNKAAVQAEELSMLSFGGSVDDDVKYGALAALYDHHAKYVLEIYSVRGKKYKFDLMDSTLSNGTVPRLPARNGGGDANQDPFVKSLCVTVTDHTITPPPPDSAIAAAAAAAAVQKEVEEAKPAAKEDDGGEDATKKKAPPSSPEKAKKPKYAMTKINLIMEGNLKNEHTLLPPNTISDDIQATFLALNHKPPDMATATPSGHTLLLDPDEAGKVYINGRYVTTWGDDPRIGSHFPALFGMDLHSIPYLHGRIFDFDVLKRNYAQLWQEILIDAKLVPRNIGGRLLSRLISGKDPVKEEEDDDDDEELSEDDDDDEELDEDDAKDAGEAPGAAALKEGVRAIKPSKPKRADTGADCLESQVMQSTRYDPVGISAKALATKFQLEYGEEGFPCLQHEIDWVKDRLPGRVPVAVPQRLISILRRGGYFDTKRTSDEVWFSESRPASEGKETELVTQTVALLKEAGCSDVHANMIVFFSGEGILGDAAQKKGLVRFNRAMRQYHINEWFLRMDIAQYQPKTDGEEEKEDALDDEGYDDDDALTKIPERAHLLGLLIAKHHPDGSVLLRYTLRHSHIETTTGAAMSKEGDDDEPEGKKRKIS